MADESPQSTMDLWQTTTPKQYTHMPQADGPPSIEYRSLETTTLLKFHDRLTPSPQFQLSIDLWKTITPNKFHI